jgi:hypothetical protein
METTFKINRFPKSNSICDDIALICAKSNGMNESGKITLNDIESYIKCQRFIFPSSSDGLVVSRIDEFHLIIDKDLQPALEILQMEVVDLPELHYDQSAN